MRAAAGRTGVTWEWWSREVAAVPRDRFVGFGASGAPDAAKGVFDEVGYKTLALDVVRERALLAEA